VNVTCKVYFLEIYNPKRSIYPQLQSHYPLKYKQGPPCPLLCIFIIFYFVALLDAMNESVLDKLKIKVREKELARKAKSARRESIE
jgi:hypothetical protein